MSEGPRMSYPFASHLANHLVEILKPDCQRIEIAGSLRRKKETIGDLELVIIPKDIEDLFGGAMFGSIRIEDALRREGFILPMNGQFHKQARLSGVVGPTVLWDIYLTTPEKWGVIFTLRTGSPDFSKWLVTQKRHGGALPSNMKVDDGHLWCGEDQPPLETPEEEDFFKRIGLAWIPPELRTDGRWVR